jgi:nucleoid-associated protein YgaU
MRTFLLRLIVFSGLLFMLAACSSENKPSSQTPEAAKKIGGGDVTDQVRWHEVRKGDTLSGIAKQYYGYS